MKKESKLAFVVVAIGLLVVIIVAVEKKVISPKTQRQEVVIGAIEGLSGAYASVGESFDKGVRLATEEWNTTHPDRSFTLIVEDDGFDPKKGLSAYRKLVDVNKVDALINMTSATIDAIYDNATHSGIPVALGFEQGIEAKDDNVVQLWPGTVPAESALGASVQKQGFKNVVVFVNNDIATFTRFFDGFTQGYTLPVSEFKVNTGSDMRTEATKALSSKPDAFVFLVTPKQGALLIQQIEALSTEKHQYIFDASIQTGFSDYVKILGNANRLNGGILYTVPENYLDTFKGHFKQKYGQDPGIGSETGYNAFLLLALTYNPNHQAWVNNMKHLSFDGADGKVVFDKNGVRIPELKIGTIQDGKLPN